MRNDRGVLLFGYGQAGRLFHAPLIRSTPGLDLRAIVTNDPERRAHVAIDLPGVRVHASAEDAWQQLKDIDIAVIASANRTHVSLALEAARHHLHMVIDKPLAATVEQAQNAIESAALAGVQIHPFHNRRWDSDFLTLRSLVDQGALGRLHRFESRFERLRTLPTGNWRESSDPEDLGGVLLDYGTHLVDQAMILMGPVTSVSCSARSIRNSSAANDDMQLILTHADSSISLLFASQSAAFGDPRFILFGTTGGVRINQPDSQQAALKAGVLPSDPAYGFEPAGSTAHLRLFEANGDYTDSHIHLVAGRWNTFYPRVLAAIEGGAVAPVSCLDVVAGLRVLDAARRSAELGESIPLSPPAYHD